MKDRLFYGARFTILLLITLHLNMPSINASDEESLVNILIQPKEALPHNWQVKKPITLAVVVRSKTEPSLRYLYLETNIVLAATRTRENCVEALLSVNQNQRAKILEAAEFDELWFVALPYRESHDKLLKEQGEAFKYLKDHQEYESAGSTTWGVGNEGPSLNPPNAEQLLEFRSLFRKPSDKAVER